jgi:hypothetical protein
MVGALSAYGVPAMAANTGAPFITFSTAAGCSTCRTLLLSNTDGSNLSTLNLSSGAGAFLANVQDTGIAPAALGNFSVTATMSNLYQFDSGSNTYTCAVSIPSSAINMNSVPTLLNASGLGASLQPVLSITGNITTLITAPVLALLGGTVPVGTPDITGVQGDIQHLASLSQSELANGSAVSSLVGSLLNNLPVSLSTGTGGAFTNPAAPPSGSGCTPPGGTATAVPVLNGALSSTPLLGDLQTALGNPTVTQLITDGLISSTTAESLISSATKLQPAVLETTFAPALVPLLTQIENTLTAAVTGIVSAATTLTGTYGSEPVMGINGAGAAPATYQGVLTVTLTSGT